MVSAGMGIKGDELTGASSYEVGDQGREGTTRQLEMHLRKQRMGGLTRHGRGLGFLLRRDPQ